MTDDERIAQIFPGLRNRDDFIARVWPAYLKKCGGPDALVFMNQRFHQRQTLEAIAADAGVDRSTVWRCIRRVSVELGAEGLLPVTWMGAEDVAFPRNKLSIETDLGLW
jgi:hypothetical protein